MRVMRAWRLAVVAALLSLTASVGARAEEYDLKAGPTAEPGGLAIWSAALFADMCVARAPAFENAIDDLALAGFSAEEGGILLHENGRTRISINAERGGFACIVSFDGDDGAVARARVEAAVKRIADAESASLEADDGETGMRWLLERKGGLTMVHVVEAEQDGAQYVGLVALTFVN